MKEETSETGAPVNREAIAFTLIELLVVIALVALLSGIALPVFMRVEEKGWMTKDASNLRQIGMGMAQYLYDNGNDLTLISTGSNGWTGVLYPTYVGNEFLYQSHFDTRSPAVSTAGAWSGPASFAINGDCFKVPAADKWSYPSSLALIVYGMGSDNAFHGIINDNNASWNGYKNPVVSPPSPSSAPTSYPNATAPTEGVYQNNAALTVMYADFHVGQGVKWTTYKTQSVTAGDAADILWNPQSPTPTP